MTEDLLRRGAKLDRYEIRELIGQGGMGEVYRAWDGVLNRDVAVKVLTLRDEDMLRRFEREADAIGKLDNPNVVEIHDFSMKGEHPYIVMEYLRGESLADRLKRGAMPVAEAVEVVLGVCRGVSACHRLGIIHRDVKPGNVFLCETAHYGTVVKVLDFGVAKPARHVKEDLTGPGKMVGTPRYLAPEQVRGQEGDELSDQYGIGMLLYVALTGQPPFGRKEKKELAEAILRAEYPRPREKRPEIPEGLEAANLKAMSAERSARYSSVVQLGRALVPYAPPEEQETWSENFGHDGEDGRASMSGSVTKVEGVMDGRRTATTEVVDPEVVAELARRSCEASATEVDMAVRNPTEAPRRETGGVVRPVAHLLSDTRVDSSLVMGGKDSTWTHAGGVLETKDGAKERRRMGRGKKVLFVAVILLAAVALGGITALVVAGLRGARDTLDLGQKKWATMGLKDAERFGEIRDGGGGGSKGEVGRIEEAPAPGTDVEGKSNVEGSAEQGAVEEAAAPKSPPARKKFRKKKLEYTKDGSPILM